MVDEIGDLERELAPHKPKITRLDNLRKKLRDEYEGQPAASAFTSDGARYAIEVGARGWQTLIDVSKLFKSVKVNDFLKMAGITLKALNSTCSPAVAASVISEAQTGPRSLVVTAKGAPGA